MKTQVEDTFHLDSVLFVQPGMQGHLLFCAFHGNQIDEHLRYQTY